MPVRIIRSTEPITVEHPLVVIYSQPGWGKSSTGFTATRPLCLDFDGGAHRSAFRKDLLEIKGWGDVVDLMKDGKVLDDYSTLIVDTVGRCLDLMSLDIIKGTPKYGRDGNLTQQGWGVLKGRFRGWMTELRALGKDVILLSHDKEDKAGEGKIVRPDIAGGSYSEVMKLADFVGYGYIEGRERKLDFSPTESYIGKNPGNWTPIVVPNFGKEPEFMAGLLDQGRKALGRIGEQSAEAQRLLADWGAKLEECTRAADFESYLKEIAGLPKIIGDQLKTQLKRRRESVGVGYDTTKKCFTDPAPKAEAA